MIQAPMTVKEARKLLGGEYSEMSDEQVQRLVDDLSLLAKLALEDAKTKLIKEDGYDNSR